MEVILLGEAAGMLNTQPMHLRTLLEKNQIPGEFVPGRGWQMSRGTVDEIASTGVLKKLCAALMPQVGQKPLRDPVPVKRHVQHRSFVRQRRRR